MNRYTYSIVTKEGDEYAIVISSISKSLFADELIPVLDGVELYEICLNRISGSNPASLGTLFDISGFIAQTLINLPDAIFYYYCDDMHDISRRDANISPQGFRSRLFSRMMDRYVEKYQIDYVENTPVQFRTDHDIYIHFIAHTRHHEVVQLLKEAIIEMSRK